MSAFPPAYPLKGFCVVVCIAKLVVIFELSK